jgi:putative transposase
MPEYRRSRVPGGTYFFTIVTYNRRPLFTSRSNCQLFLNAWNTVQSRHPFESIASCLLTDHIHAIWKLPEGDDDYPMRWKEIKRIFTKEFNQVNHQGMARSLSQQIQGEATIFQRRYWEHTIRNEEDLTAHIDYVHINPLKHGLVNAVVEWPWSSFHRYVRTGIYPPGWGGRAEIRLMDAGRGE